MEQAKPDLDARPQVEHFVDLFYQRLLADESLSPIFLEVARVDLAQHLPHIKDYWCKLLLGEEGYRRHTMNVHRQLHHKRPLAGSDFQRWLAHFQDTLDAHFAGPYTEKARRIATAIAANMERGLPLPPEIEP